MGSRDNEGGSENIVEALLKLITMNKLGIELPKVEDKAKVAPKKAPVEKVVEAVKEEVK
jgi:hypothetical protein